MRRALRYLLFAGIVASAFWTLPATPVLADSAARSMTREQIRSLPILERPNRFGHFYGNTVRRRYYRHHTYSSVGAMHSNSQVPATNG
ncbi:hypothetical protein [Thermopirellula anaerolimosa]